MAGNDAIAHNIYIVLYSVMIGPLYKPTPTVASIDLQVLLRLRPSRHQLLCDAIAHKLFS